MLTAPGLTRWRSGIQSAIIAGQSVLHFCMVARRYVPVRLSPTGYEAIKALADAETGGNLSEMVRILLGEAVQARRSVTQKPKRPT